MARAVKGAVVALMVGYPLLAIAYLADEFGAIVEPIFFLAFSVMVAVELFEPSARRVTSQ